MYKKFKVLSFTLAISLFYSDVKKAQQVVRKKM